MPNHCTNEVTINFKDLEQKEAFRKWVDNGDDNPLDFERILPYPKGIETVTDILTGKKKKVVVGGEWNHAWCSENWGTKWNSYSWEDFNDPWEDEDDETSVDLKFETAWGPPTGILEKIHEKFPELSYVRWFYRDEADMFCGYLDADVGISNA